MKQSEFAELCQREWSQPYRGDVVTLNLTNESLAEWSADIVSAGSLFDCGLGGPFESGPKAATVGIRVAKVVNPVTRSTVTVNGDADIDSATAECGPDWAVSSEPLLRVVPIG